MPLPNGGVNISIGEGYRPVGFPGEALLGPISGN
jgi:hypothetical protein